MKKALSDAQLTLEQIKDDPQGWSFARNKENEEKLRSDMANLKGRMSPIQRRFLLEPVENLKKTVEKEQITAELSGLLLLEAEFQELATFTDRLARKRQTEDEPVKTVKKARKGKDL